MWTFYLRMSYYELRNECGLRDLSTRGNKNDLVIRLSRCDFVYELEGWSYAELQEECVNRGWKAKGVRKKLVRKLIQGSVNEVKQSLRAVDPQ